MRQMVVGFGEKIVGLRQVSHVYPLVLPPENRSLRSIGRQPRPSRYSFWKFRAQKTHCNFTTTKPSAPCKHNYIAVDVTCRRADARKFQFLEYYSRPLEPFATWQNR